MTTADGEPRPVLALAGVEHRYGDRAALDGVTLAFEAGTATAIIGPDGVGKSTLLGLLVGVRRMQTGEIDVFGGSMREASWRDAVARRVAYMPQGLGRCRSPRTSTSTPGSSASTRRRAAPASSDSCARPGSIPSPTGRRASSPAA